VPQKPPLQKEVEYESNQNIKRTIEIKPHKIKEML
jgi:hypothetical protein